ncbi:MAG: hypothetical protein GY930_18460 [bacterium]|nr:hypothetical protein [bacterium]
MSLRRKNRDDQTGAALISSLFFVTLVTAMGAGLVQLSTVSTKKQIVGIDTTLALYVAEAGLSEAFLAVAQGRSGMLASPEEPAEFGTGYFWVEATSLPNDQVQLESTGMVGHGRFTLSMVLHRSINEVGSLGMCGLNDVTIGAGAQLDTLEVTSEGERGEGSPGEPKPTKVRSNGDITVFSNESTGSPTQINGNIHPGPNGIADLDPGVIVTGTTASSSRGITLPTFKIPRLGPSRGDLLLSGQGANITLDSDKAYDNINVPSGTQLTLKGPMRVRLENLTVYNGGQIVIDTTEGPVGIYSTGTTIFDSGSNLVNVGEDPTQCSLFALTTDSSDKSIISMQGSGAFFGMIIAPKSPVDIPGNLRIAGSIVSESLSIGADAHISFTPQLEKGGFGVEMTPTIVAWQILDVPDTLLTRGPGNIDSKIQLNGIMTKLSATSAPEVDVKMKYLSTTKMDTTYVGTAIAIPWTDIDHVYTVQWKKDGLYLDERAPKVIVDAVDEKTGNADLVVGD